MTYGFEDYISHRYKNFNLNLINSKVYHHDFRNFKDFLKNIHIWVFMTLMN